MNHVIKTQVFDVITNKKEDAFELQQKLSVLFYSTILPVLEKTFDELAPDDKLIHLDKIEIDLGRIPFSDLSGNTWSLQFREIFSRQFRDHVFSGKKLDAPGFLSYSITQQWLYYMKNGFLPWNAIRTDENWYLNVLEGLASDHKSIEALRVLIHDDRQAVRRIVLLHDPVFLTHLVEVLTARKQEKLVTMIEAIVHSLNIRALNQSGETIKVATRRRFWEAIFQILVSSRKAIQPTEIISELMIQEFDAHEVQLLITRVDEEELLNPFLPLLKKLLDQQPETDLVKKKPIAEDKETEKIKSTKIPEEGLFVPQAGLVLLHPFLIRFFTYLSLFRDGKFIDAIAQQKALLLLHFLAMGNTQFEEHELVVAKCLCGYILDEPVDPLLIPTGDMLNECEELLKEVIVQWSVLKNTSPEALRVNFLQRPGKLYTKNEEPHLMVEANVLDVLLDRLPWGIGMIKLPWMEKVLRVEWR